MQLWDGLQIDSLAECGVGKSALYDVTKSRLQAYNFWKKAMQANKVNDSFSHFFFTKDEPM